MVLILFQVAPWAFASMGDHALVGAQHGHPLQYKVTENFWRRKAAYGRVAET